MDGKKKIEMDEEVRDRCALSRRQMLKLGTALGATILVTSGLSRSARAEVLTSCPQTGPLTTPLLPFKDPLPIPPFYRPADHARHYKINTTNILHQFHADLPPMPAWGFDGQTPGPTLQANRDVSVKATFYNNLDGYVLCPDPRIHGTTLTPYLTVHNHGLLDRPEDDGFPEDRFPPAHAAVPHQNNYYTYNYPNIQQAANYWYHDHSLGTTRINIYSGLFGFYLLRDKIELSLRIPVGPPYEVPIVINDKEFSADGKELWFPYPWDPEFCGRFTTVNQKVWPFMNVRRGVYRFRILNGSDDRFYRLHFTKNGQPLDQGFAWQIGTDGGFLPRPVPLPVTLGGPPNDGSTGLLLAPAERADVLIDFSKFAPGDEIVVTNDAPCPFPGGPSPATQFGSDLYATVMKFVVGTGTGRFSAIPSFLADLPQFEAPYYTRHVALNEVPYECAPPNSGILQPRLNNLPWDFPPTEVAQADGVENWKIINTTGDTHPIHLHQTQFRILYRQQFDVAAYVNNVWKPNMGSSVPMCDKDLNNQCVYPSGQGPANGMCYPQDQGPLPPPVPKSLYIGAPVLPDPNEKGLKDTVRSWPGFINVIKVPFGPFEGRFVWHCHMLSHEDNEMMRPLMLISDE